MFCQFSLFAAFYYNCYKKEKKNGHILFVNPSCRLIFEHQKTPVNLSFPCPIFWTLLFIAPPCLLPPRSSVPGAALIEYWVGDGTQSSRWAVEKGSNSRSQDGSVAHNDPAIPSAPPHRFTTETPLLRQLFNSSPLPPCPHAHTVTCIRIHVQTSIHLCSSGAHTCVTVCHLCCCSHCFGPFWSVFRAGRQPFYFSHHAGLRLLG